MLRSINSHMGALVAHANARFTVHGRLLLVGRVLSGHKPGEVAKQLGVSRQTVYKWVRRYLAEGLEGLADPSSRPQSMPRATTPRTTARIVALRLALHTGAVRVAADLGLVASTEIVATAVITPGRAGVSVTCCVLDVLQGNLSCEGFSDEGMAQAVGRN